ncbi:hypothetical protein HZU73_08275 [Apis mellifera caucasica]|uniref:Uncharacterized protein LOC107965801 n=1 Tax=Apis mellifera TaxID=7460 RepID=A0A7M7IKY8_APIME|nr:uncharacterized protein LOC107965801 [Apis mellifera]KAG6796150.1 hypothetical protein HZU73_08275 [Apis mellifera caucasica]KAG9427872.1 hypothetical protein HZU67_10189 [Apis mellifera carnica]|eukprot:XP_016772907.1 uncharacterized protein LOC107965801 [Apis mellifera]
MFSEENSRNRVTGKAEIDRENSDMRKKLPLRHDDSRRKDVVVAVQRQLELELVARGRGRGRGRPEEVNRSNGGSGVGTITMESPIIQSSLRAGPFKPFSAPHLLLVDLETNRFSNETAAIPLSFAFCLVLIAKTID